MVDRVDIQNVLEQMRTIRTQVESPQTSDPANSQFANTINQLQQQVQNANQTAAISETQPSDAMQNQLVGDVPSFGEMLKSAVDTVNGNQQAANELATRYEMGDPKVDLPEVMIALQKSSTSFQAMTQVRNKMIEAYKEIINMPL